MRISGVIYVPRKTHKLRKFLVTILLLVFIIFLAVAAISAYLGWNIVHPEKENIKPFSANIVPEYNNLSFTSKDGKTSLDGWWFDAKNSNQTIILAHAYGQNRLQFGEQTLDLIKSFNKEGYNILSFDLRNSGKSDGNVTSMGYHEKDDLLAAISYAKAVGSEHIVLMGFSTGASAAILAAAESDSVAAIIADSPFSNMEKYISYRLPKKSYLPSALFLRPVILSVEIIAGMKTNEANPSDKLADISGTPVLFIHGKNDTEIPAENSSELYNIHSMNPGGLAEIWLPQDVGHLQSYQKYSDEYIEKIFDFLEKNN